MTQSQIQSIFNLARAHDCSTRCDLRDRVRFENPASGYWASLAWPNEKIPYYRIWLHHLPTPGIRTCKHVDDLGTALDLINVFLGEVVIPEVIPASHMILEGAAHELESI
jgi:hypothetical protein